MRAKIVIPVILFAGVFLFYGYWFRPQPASSEATATPAAMPAKALISAATVQPNQPRPAAAMSPVTTTEADQPASEDRDVDRHIVSLEELAMNNDSESLQLILLSLTDTHAQIREAALEAVIQFNSPEAIPWLQAALPKLEISREKEQVLAAIEFLKLQPLQLSNVDPPQ